jgi:sugar/nucleoside kinase (ribokinase family)
MYTTPVLAVETDRLNATEILSSKAFHFLEDPRNIESRISSLLTLRESAGIMERPLIIWEPAPPSCNPENLATCLTAARRVDVFSPNHIELLGLYGERPPSTLDRTRIEALALNFIESGIGPDRAGAVIVRAGEYGAMIRSRDSSPRWLPPFYESTLDGQLDPKVVDPTGAGNAFLGAYAVGFLKTGDNIQAACYGAVGASFALEQVAVPEKTCTEDKELWNGVNVQDRLHEYISNLAAADPTGVSHHASVIVNKTRQN